MTALGPFQALFGDVIAIRAYIFMAESASTKNQNDKAGLSKASAVPYVVLLHKATEIQPTEATLYTVVANDLENINSGNGEKIFCLSRLSPFEIMLDLVPTNALVTSQRRNKQNVLLLHVNIESINLKKLLVAAQIQGFQDIDGATLKIVPPDNSNSILFGSKMDTDIFVRSLEHHSTNMNSVSSSNESSLTGDDSVKKDIKPKSSQTVAKGQRKRSSSVVVSLRRTSTSECDGPTTYEVIGMTIGKKRKGSRAISTTPVEPPSNFYFIIPKDYELLTDYYILLYSQVKRGVMSEEDLAMTNRKNSASAVDTGIGFLGFRCRHCGGKQRGSYFPSSCKNLQACPPTLHSHLLKCSACPDTIKRSLKLCKTKHKQDMIKMKPGAQTIFYNQLWTRIQDATFDGEANTQAVQQRLKLIEEKCVPLPDTTAETEGVDRDEMVPTTVSDISTEMDMEELEYDEALVSEALTTTAPSPGPVTDEDWDMAFEILRRPPTPNNPGIPDNPPESINVTPIPVQNFQAPMPVRISASGEMYRNGEFIIPERYNDPTYDFEAGARLANANNNVSTPKKKSYSDDDGKTRKFTRNDEVLLVRGILLHGKRWKRIWDNEPLLQHIKHSALKDRARSRRFKDILARAENDPSLLNDPEKLCGSEHQPEYMDDLTKASPYSANVLSETSEDDSDGGCAKQSSSPSTTPVRYVVGVPIEALVDVSPFQKSPKK